MHKLPSFDLLWAKYPNGAPEAVKAMIGGKANAAWITNTCTIRISYAFNKAGSPIPGGFPGLNTVRGADGMHYAYRVAEFHRFMESRFGKPPVVGGRKQVEGKKGVICFEVHGWSDASGHFDLWDGAAAAHAEYFDKASKVFLWTC